VPEVVILEGLPELKAALVAHAAKLNAAAVEAVAVEADLVKEDARAHVHMRSGALRDGIDARVEGTTAVIGSESHHGAANEFGTSKMAANPFMTPAADVARTRFPEGAAKVIKGAIE
jgi:HK97 gp10 family phage protein